METSLLYESTENGVVVIAGVFLMFFMSLMLVLFFYHSQKKIFGKEMERRNAELAHHKDLLQATLTAQEEERRRIARDLHDGIGAKLSVISLNSHMLTAGGLTGMEVSEITGTIITLVSKALEDSRRMAHGLLPPVLDQFGLEAALRELASECSSKILKVSLENTVRLDGIEKNRQLHVFRIIQELLSNSLRHGKASTVRISFVCRQGKTTCRYADNGKGFDLHDTGKKGLGMKNIESRIIFLGGSMGFDTGTGTGCGTKVEFNF
jgi:signal transduction histidine kinase